MTLAERIFTVLKRHPNADAADVAKRCETSAGYVRCVCTRNGIKIGALSPTAKYVSEKSIETFRHKRDAWYKIQRERRKFRGVAPISRDRELELIERAVERGKIKTLDPAYAAPITHQLLCRDMARTRVPARMGIR